MRIVFCFFLTLCTFFSPAQKFITRFEQSNGTETPTYSEVIRWWKTLDIASPIIHMKEIGETDAGVPLHLVLVSGDRDFSLVSLKRKKRSIILVLNGIHPGEPDGIDASMLLVRAIVEQKQTLPPSVVLAIIPVYNIGGALNRSKNFRVDQNGPEEFGFRGNAQNLDLNRDFIKADSKNALSFFKLFHLLDPDVLVDNHVSNGADYQHVMTLIASQHNKLGGVMGDYMNQKFVPALYQLMKQKGYDLVPYVNHFTGAPDKGWSEFWDSPRYSSGYASLWHTFAFVPETHMLKPYRQRVDATKALMESFIRFTAEKSNEIKLLRKQQKDSVRRQQQFPIRWELDTTRFSPVTFKGYQWGKRESEVSGLPRLYYDRSQPFTRTVPFYNVYQDTAWIKKPLAYVIPQGWWKVIERLKANNVQMRPLTSDTAIEVEAYRIIHYHSTAQPYEGHHPNSQVRVSKSVQRITFRRGDYFVSLNQPANRFLIETLEPEAEDSYFSWNFFDPILQQKEGFSDYVFEETAAHFLKTNPEVRMELERRKKADSSFAQDAAGQLNFVYRQSPYYEAPHLQYPVYRVCHR